MGDVGSAVPAHAYGGRVTGGGGRDRRRRGGRCLPRVPVGTVAGVATHEAAVEHGLTGGVVLGEVRLLAPSERTGRRPAAPERRPRSPRFQRGRVIFRLRERRGALPCDRGAGSGSRHCFVHCGRPGAVVEQGHDPVIGRGRGRCAGRQRGPAAGGASKAGVLAAQRPGGSGPCAGRSCTRSRCCGRRRQVAVAGRAGSS